MVQGAGSRAIFAFARDGGLPGGKSLALISEKFKTPANALFGGALVTVVFLGLSFASPTDNVKVLWFSYPGGTNVLAALSTYAVAGMYLALLLTVIASIVARVRGRVPDGQFTLGRWAWPVSVAALVYLALILADLVAPTGLNNARAYINDDWITLLVMAIVALVGVIVFLAAHRGRELGEHVIDGDPEAAPEPVTVPDTSAAGTAAADAPEAS